MGIGGHLLLSHPHPRGGAPMAISKHRAPDIPAAAPSLRFISAQIFSSPGVVSLQKSTC